MVVSFAVLPWVVTYPTLFPQERCVTTLKTAAQETSHQFSDHVIEIFRFEDEEEYKLRTRFNLKFCGVISINVHPRQDRRCKSALLFSLWKEAKPFPDPKIMNELLTVENF